MLVLFIYGKMQESGLIEITTFMWYQFCGPSILCFLILSLLRVNCWEVVAGIDCLIVCIIFTSKVSLRLTVGGSYNVMVWWMKNSLFTDISSVHSLSHVQLCEPMDSSMLGLPIHHQLQQLTQTNVHWISDVIQPFHPLSSPSPPTFNLS